MVFPQPCVMCTCLFVLDYVKNCDMMWKQSVWSSSIAASLAAKHLKEGGLLTLPGAMPALKGTPGIHSSSLILIMNTSYCNTEAK